VQLYLRRLAQLRLLLLFQLQLSRLLLQLLHLRRL
jgi:hypothetical protein